MKKITSHNSTKRGNSVVLFSIGIFLLYFCLEFAGLSVCLMRNLPQIERKGKGKKIKEKFVNLFRSAKEIL